MSVVATNTDDVLTLAVDRPLVGLYGRALENMALSASDDAKGCARGDVDARARFVKALEDIGRLRDQLTRAEIDGSASLTGRRSLLQEAAFLAASSAARSLDEVVETVGASEEPAVRFTLDRGQQEQLLLLNDTCFAAVGMLVALQPPSRVGDDTA